MIRNNGPPPNPYYQPYSQRPHRPNQGQSHFRTMTRVQSQPSLQPQSRQFIRAQSRQVSRSRLGPNLQPISNYLTYPSHIPQQQIPKSAIGLPSQRTVQGPTVKWSPTKATFLGSAYTGSCFGTGISSDPEYLSKGVDILLKRQTGTLYCPVCEANYSTGALQEHIRRHRQLDDIKSKQVFEQTKVSHRQSALLSQVGLSAQIIHTPVIIQPEEFVVDEKPQIVNNLFVVNNVQIEPVRAIPAEIQTVERVPLQYPIERINFYSCFDGLANRQDSFTCADTCRVNECVTQPRQLMSWQIQKLQSV